MALSNQNTPASQSQQNSYEDGVLEAATPGNKKITWITLRNSYLLRVNSKKLIKLNSEKQLPSKSF